MVTYVKAEEHGESLGPVLHPQELFMNIYLPCCHLYSHHLSIENYEKYWLPQEYIATIRVEDSKGKKDPAGRKGVVGESLAFIVCSDR